MIAESNGLDVEKTQALAAAGEFALGLPGPNTGIKAVDATAKGLNYYELKEVTVGLADAYSTQKSSGTNTITKRELTYSELGAEYKRLLDQKTSTPPNLHSRNEIEKMIRDKIKNAKSEIEYQDGLKLLKEIGL